MKMILAAALLLAATAVAAQDTTPTSPTPTSTPPTVVKTEPAKPATRRVCTVQAFTGGLIRKQKTCSQVPVAIGAAPVSSAAAPVEPQSAQR